LLTLYLLWYLSYGEKLKPKIEGPQSFGENRAPFFKIAKLLPGLGEQRENFGLGNLRILSSHNYKRCKLTIILLIMVLIFMDKNSHQKSKDYSHSGKILLLSFLRAPGIETASCTVLGEQREYTMPYLVWEI
jgi:hypothetical protein